MTDQQKKMLQAKCQNLLKEYGDIILDFHAQIVKETEGPIIGITSDEIALEYKRREGIRYGAIQLISKLNNNANER